MIIDQKVNSVIPLTEAEIRVTQVDIKLKYGLSISAYAVKRDENTTLTGDDIIPIFKHCCYCDNGMTYQGKEIYFTREAWEYMKGHPKEFPLFKERTSGIGKFCLDDVMHKLNLVMDHQEQKQDDRNDEC